MSDANTHDIDSSWLLLWTLRAIRMREPVDFGRMVALIITMVGKEK